MNAVWPLLSGARPNDPYLAPTFCTNFLWIQGKFWKVNLRLKKGFLMTCQHFPRRHGVRVCQQMWRLHPQQGEDDMMAVDLRGDEDDDDMEIGMVDRLDHCIHWYHQDAWNEFASQESCVEVGSKATVFSDTFGGINIQVEVPQEVNDELTGLPLDHQQVVDGMKTEVKQLETLKVETEARKISKEKDAKILTSRWVNTQKNPTLARCRLVVRDFGCGAESAFLGLEFTHLLHLRTP